VWPSFAAPTSRFYCCERELGASASASESESGVRLASMRYLDSTGRVRQQQSFTCGKCGGNATPDLVFRDDLDPRPRDLSINCPHCGAHVATINPTEAAVSIAPPAAADPEIMTTAEAAALEIDESKAAADMQLEADIEQAQIAVDRAAP
jgi:hypothetical protein